LPPNKPSAPRSWCSAKLMQRSAALRTARPGCAACLLGVLTHAAMIHHICGHEAVTGQVDCVRCMQGQHEQQALRMNPQQPCWLVKLLCKPGLPTPRKSMHHHAAPRQRHHAQRGQLLQDSGFRVQHATCCCTHPASQAYLLFWGRRPQPCLQPALGCWCPLMAAQQQQQQQHSVTHPGQTLHTQHPHPNPHMSPAAPEPPAARAASCQQHRMHAHASIQSVACTSHHQSALHPVACSAAAQQVPAAMSATLKLRSSQQQCSSNACMP
jgi:hypothetical protein